MDDLEVRILIWVTYSEIGRLEVKSATNMADRILGSIDV